MVQMLKWMWKFKIKILMPSIAHMTLHHEKFLKWAAHNNPNQPGREEKEGEPIMFDPAWCINSKISNQI